jgi:Holliday junction DNA helicase RuvB
MTDDIISYSSEDPQGLVSGQVHPEDLEAEIVSLRPRHLIDYVGQSDVVETLKIAIEAALQRNEPIDHVLLHGPPGLGKTTLAHIIANETGSNLTLSSGPALEKGGDLIGILTHLESGESCSSMKSRPCRWRSAHPAMEDRHRFRVRQGCARPQPPIPPEAFHPVGATTRWASPPPADRFGIFRSLDFTA